jgi:hypothetical protein
MTNLLRLFAGMALALVLSCGSAKAMDILAFGRMNLDDQATYVTNMVEGSAKYLRANGHPDQAQKAIDLFKNSTPQGGVNQLAINLKNFQSENTRNQQNPNNRVPPYDVEAAMAETLRDNGINVPASYLKTITRGFQPFFPLRTHIGGT